MKTWGILLWTTFITLIVAIGYLLYILFNAYSSVGCLIKYVIWVVSIPIFMAWNTKRLEPQGYSFHIHHYLVAAILLTILCYQSNFVTFIHGAMNGMAIEGGVRWGFDAIWFIDDGRF